MPAAAVPAGPRLGISCRIGRDGLLRREWQIAALSLERFASLTSAIGQARGSAERPPVCRDGTCPSRCPSPPLPKLPPARAANSNACLESPPSQRPCRQMLNLPHKKSEDRIAAVTVQNQYVRTSTEPCPSSRRRGVNAAAKHVDFGNAHACLVLERGFNETENWE